MAPASNLVAVLSLDWLDCNNQAPVSAKTHGWNCPATLPRTPKKMTASPEEKAFATSR